MRILDKIKSFIWWHSPFVWRSELIEIEDMFIKLFEANQEYELLMRNDMRLMFNAMNKMNEKKPDKKNKNGTGNMYG